MHRYCLTPDRAELGPHACHQPWEMPALLSAFLIPRCKPETKDLLKANLVNSTWLPLELGKQLRTELKRIHDPGHEEESSSLQHRRLLNVGGSRRLSWRQNEEGLVRLRAEVQTGTPHTSDPRVDSQNLPHPSPWSLTHPHAPPPPPCPLIHPHGPSPTPMSPHPPL